MADSVNHSLYGWRKLVFNTSINLAVIPESQGTHGALLPLMRVANKALNLSNSDSSHSYPLNTLSMVMPLRAATVTGSRNCSNACNVALTTL
jgi:hypothetical protein